MIVEQVPVPNKGKENAQCHKTRIRYSTMHIDEKTIKQDLLKGEWVTRKMEGV